MTQAPKTTPSKKHLSKIRRSFAKCQVTNLPEINLVNAIGAWEAVGVDVLAKSSSYLGRRMRDNLVNLTAREVSLNAVTKHLDAVNKVARKAPAKKTVSQQLADKGFLKSGAVASKRVRILAVKKAVAT